MHPRVASSGRHYAADVHEYVREKRRRGGGNRSGARGEVPRADINPDGVAARTISPPSGAAISDFGEPRSLYN